MIRESTTRLLDWYATRARPFIEAHARPDLAILDGDRDRLRTAVNAIEDSVAVCFVGNSGVGKSTLLNALLSDRYSILPHGGIGPQTARPTTVQYAAKPHFRASYAGAKEVSEMRFLLEVAHQLATKGTSDQARLEPSAEQVDENTVREMEAVLRGDASPGQEAGPSKLEQAQKRARLVVQGSQDGTIDLPYLIDAIRTIMGNKAMFGRAVAPEDEERIAQARECVNLGRLQKSRVVEAGDNPAPFVEQLAKHASGSLAPLIMELVVGWNSDLLANGLVLVDLPGLGVSGDEYDGAAAAWIGQKARAVVIVTDRSGLTTASVEPLRKARFFINLLHGDDGADVDPVSLGMVMVRVDDVATAAWESEFERRGDDVQPWGEIFTSTRAEGLKLMRAHAQQELDRIVEDGNAATREDLARAIARLRDSLEIHAVSAPEYRRFLRKHPLHPAKVANVDESGIPGLQKALMSIAGSYRQARVAKGTAAMSSFAQHTRATINLVRVLWEQEARAEQEARVLAEELDVFLAPLRKELEARRQRFATFLRETVPALISAAVNQAALDTAPAVGRYLRGMKSLHWATLAATVRKDGKHEASSGKVINLPKELALRFEEPVAVAWSKEVLTKLRKRTGELGQDYSAMTAQVVEWARSRHARVQPKLVEALHERIEAQTKSLAKVGKEAIAELRADVSQQLGAELEEKIRIECRKFVDKGGHKHKGAKDRIVDELLVGDLARLALGAAQLTAQGILLKAYQQAESEIESRLRELSDPLQAARDTLVQSHEDSVRRSDAKKKKHVIGEVEAILGEMPLVASETEQAS